MKRWNADYQLTDRNFSKFAESTRCFDGWDFERKDFIVGDPESPISARELFLLYDKT